MTPLRIAIADPDDARRERLRSLLRCLPNMEIVAQSTTADVAEIFDLSAAPDACLVALGDEPRRTLGAVARLTAHDPRRPVMVIGNAEDGALVREAMRAGAREFLHSSIDPCELAAAIGRAGSLLAGRQRTGRLIAVLPAVGGCGATTLAVNLAVALRSGGAETALVDLVRPLGTAALYLDIRATHSIEDVCEGSQHLDLTVVREALTHHESGVELLAASSATGLESPHDASRTRDVLVLLRAMFPHVVVDLPRTLDTTALDVLRMADEVLLVTRQSVAGAANAGRLATAIMQSGVEPAQIRIVINAYLARREISDGRIRELLAQCDIVRIPEDSKAVARSLDLGRPLVLDAPRRPASRAILSLAQSIATHQPNGKPRNGSAFRKLLAEVRAHL